MAHVVNLVAIDFGTTNCKVAYIMDKDPVLVPNAENEFITPSIVHLKDDFLSLTEETDFDKRFVVGKNSRGYLTTHPERTFYSIKREIGTNKSFMIDNKRFTPEFIASIIFKKLMIDINSNLQTIIRNTIICVPANYSDSQRQSIKDAADIAGFNTLKLINEPTAAAIAYGIDVDVEKKVLVYDFGGGTFDVTILSIVNGFFDIDVSSGVNRCGGDDIDQLIVSKLANYLFSKHKIDINNDLSLLGTVRDQAEQAKINLSKRQSSTIYFSFIKDKNGKQINDSYELTRTEFEKEAIKIISKTKQPILDSINEAGLTVEDIDEVLLVGGTSKIPFVKQYLAEIFTENKIRSDIDPFLAVVIGASLSGLNLESDMKDRKNFDISDVTAHSYGIKVADFLSETVSHIINKNDKLPIKRIGGPFSNLVDYTEMLSFDIFQGESVDPDENYFLGNLLISVPPRPRGGNKFEVTLSVGDKFGVLEITAKDLETDKLYQTKFVIEGILSPEEKNYFANLLGTSYLPILIHNKLSNSHHKIRLRSDQTIKDVIQHIKASNVFEIKVDEKISLYFSGKRLKLTENLTQLDKGNNFGDQIDNEIVLELKKR